MAPISNIQKAIYANQTMAMEQAAVVRSLAVVAKARKELLGAIERGKGANSAQQAALSNLEGVLNSVPRAMIAALKTDNLLEAGFKQGKSLMQEVGKDTEHDEKLSGFAPILDLASFGSLTNAAVTQIKGATDEANARIKEQVEISLALGEGETQTMARIFGTEANPAAKTPFRQLRISAERISRTVSNSLVNAGKLDSYKKYSAKFPELGILHEWVNVTDFRTSDVCRALVGQKVPPGQAFQGGGFTGTAPPAHIQCRSTTIPVIGGPAPKVELPPAPRRQRTPRPTPPPPPPAPTPTPTPPTPDLDPFTQQQRKDIATKLRGRGNIFANLATQDGLGENTPEWVDGVDRQNFSIGIRLTQLADQVESNAPFRTTDDALQFISYLRALRDGDTKTLVEQALRMAKTTPQQDKEIAQWAKPLIEDGIAPPFLVDATNRFRATRNLPPIDNSPPSPPTPEPAPEPEPVARPATESKSLDERIEALFGVERDRKLKALYKKASEAETEAESDKIWREIEDFEQANPYEGGADFIDEMERLGNPRDALISDYSSGRYGDYNRPPDRTKQKLLAEVLAAKPNAPGKSYRFSDIVEGDTEVGGVVTSGDAFFSTSKDPNSRYITNRQGYVLEIEGKTGVDISPYSRYEDEREVLFNPNTRFEVVAKRIDGPHTRLTLRELTGEAPPTVATGAPERAADKSPVTLDGQLQRGKDFVSAVLGDDTVAEITKLSKQFKQDYEDFEVSRDPNSAANLRKIRDGVQKSIEGLVGELKKSGPSVSSDYSDKGDYIGESWAKPDGTTGSLTIDSSVFDHKDKHLVRGFLQDVVKLTGGDPLDGVAIVYRDRKMGKSDDRERAWARPASKIINIGGKRGKDLGVDILHETAHIVELNSNGALEASTSLVKRRATGPLTHLNEVHPDYGLDEMYHPDEFIDPYVGRDYQGAFDGTEVVTMGLQTLMNPPMSAELLLRDPEHFYYALSYLVKEIPAPKPKPEPEKVKAAEPVPTFEQYLKSLPKADRESLKAWESDVEFAAQMQGEAETRADYYKKTGLFSGYDIDKAAERGKVLFEKWKTIAAKSAHTLKNSEKVKVVSDKTQIKEVYDNFEILGKAVTVTMAKPFDGYGAMFGEESSLSDGGLGVPKLSVSFTVDGSLDSATENPREGVKIAARVRKILAASIAKLPDGTVLYNEPVGGTLGKRAFIYSLQGFGPCSPDGLQYAIVKGGKAIPLTKLDYEKLKPGDEI